MFSTSTLAMNNENDKFLYIDGGDLKSNLKVRNSKYCDLYKLISDEKFLMEASSLISHS